MRTKRQISKLFRKEFNIKEFDNFLYNQYRHYCERLIDYSPRSGRRQYQIEKELLYTMNDLIEEFIAYVKYHNLQKAQYHNSDRAIISKRFDEFAPLYHRMKKIQKLQTNLANKNI
jgi:hypothetical protein